jgi:hypothetical protein
LNATRSDVISEYLIVADRPWTTVGGFRGLKFTKSTLFEKMCDVGPTALTTEGGKLS